MFDGASRTATPSLPLCGERVSVGRLTCGHGAADKMGTYLHILSAPMKIVCSRVEEGPTEWRRRPPVANCHGDRVTLAKCFTRSIGVCRDVSLHRRSVLHAANADQSIASQSLAAIAAPSAGPSAVSAYRRGSRYSRARRATSSRVTASMRATCSSGVV